MTDRSVSLKVDGLREALTAMRKMTSQTPKEVGKYHKDVARYVSAEVKRRADARPRKKQSGHISRSVKERGTQREAAIRVTAEDARVQEFGGRAPLFGNRNKWFQVRPRKRDGYFLYPAARESMPTVERFYLKGLEGAIRSYWNQ